MSERAVQRMTEAAFLEWQRHQEQRYELASIDLDTSGVFAGTCGEAAEDDDGPMPAHIHRIRHSEHVPNVSDLLCHRV